MQKDTADLTTLQEQLKTNLQNMGQQSQIQFGMHGFIHYSGLITSKLLSCYFTN